MSFFDVWEEEFLQIPGDLEQRPLGITVYITQHLVYRKCSKNIC